MDLNGSSHTKGVRRGVIGVLSRGRTHLLIRRADHIARGGYWCFPGGHVEPKETSRRAIVRELQEELGIDAEAVERLGAIRLADPAYVLAVWRVTHDGGVLSPAPDEVAEYRWLTPAQVRDMDPALPSNADVLALLERCPGRYPD